MEAAATTTTKVLAKVVEHWTLVTFINHIITGS